MDKNNLLSKKEIKSLDNNYVLQNDLIIDENLYLAAGNNLSVQKGVKIFFKTDVTIFSEGSIFFNGTKEDPIIIYSDNNSGSLILSNNNFIFNNVIIKNLSTLKKKIRFYMVELISLIQILKL